MCFVIKRESIKTAKKLPKLSSKLHYGKNSKILIAYIVYTILELLSSIPYYLLMYMSYWV